MSRGNVDHSLHQHTATGICTLRAAAEREGLDVERLAWDVWEYIIDSLQPQWKRAGESEKWGKALRAYIVARLAQPPEAE